MKDRFLLILIIPVFYFTTITAQHNTMLFNDQKGEILYEIEDNDCEDGIRFVSGIIDNVDGDPDQDYLVFGKTTSTGDIVNPLFTYPDRKCQIYPNVEMISLKDGIGNCIGYVMAISISFDGGLTYDLHLIRTDIDGKKICVTNPYPNNSMSEFSNELIQDSDGNIVLVGTMVNSALSDLLVAKFDKECLLIDSARHHFDNPDGTPAVVEGMDIIETSNTNTTSRYVVVGRYDMQSLIVALENSLDLHTAKIWDCDDDKQTYEQARHIVQNNNEYAIVGQTTINYGIGSFPRQTYFIRFNASEGFIPFLTFNEMKKYLLPNDGNYPNDLLIKHDGDGYIVGGVTELCEVDCIGSFGSPFLMELDLAGNINILTEHLGVNNPVGYGELHDLEYDIDGYTFCGKLWDNSLSVDQNYFIAKSNFNLNTDNDCMDELNYMCSVIEPQFSYVDSDRIFELYFSEFVDFSCGEIEVEQKKCGSAPIPCDAGFVFTVDNCSGLMSFNANNQSYLSYTWDFGDGNFGSGSSTNHTYNNSGIYTVTLTVNTGFTTCSSTQNVTIDSAFDNTYDCKTDSYQNVNYDPRDDGHDQVIFNNNVYYVGASRDQFDDNWGVWVEQLDQNANQVGYGYYKLNTTNVDHIRNTQVILSRNNTELIVAADLKINGQYDVYLVRIPISLGNNPYPNGDCLFVGPIINNNIDDDTVEELIDDFDDGYVMVTNQDNGMNVSTIVTKISLNCLSYYSRRVNIDNTSNIWGYDIVETSRIIGVVNNGPTSYVLVGRADNDGFMIGLDWDLLPVNTGADLIDIDNNPNTAETINRVRFDNAGNCVIAGNHLINAQLVSDNEIWTSNVTWSGYTATLNTTQILNQNNNKYERLMDLEVSQGQIFISGETNGEYGVTISNPVNIKGFISRLDLAGNVIWNKEYANPNTFLGSVISDIEIQDCWISGIGSCWENKYDFNNLVYYQEHDFQYTKTLLDGTHQYFACQRPFNWNQIAQSPVQNQQLANVIFVNNQSDTISQDRLGAELLRECCMSDSLLCDISSDIYQIDPDSCCYSLNLNNVISSTCRIEIDLTTPGYSFVNGQVYSPAGFTVNYNTNQIVIDPCPSFLPSGNTSDYISFCVDNNGNSGSFAIEVKYLDNQGNTIPCQDTLSASCESSCNPICTGSWDNHGFAFIHDMVEYNGDIIVGGSFGGLGSTTSPNIARWNICTKQWENMGDGFNSDIYAVEVHNGELYAGGFFTTSGTNAMKGIAKWDDINSSWVSIGDINRTGSFVGSVYDLMSHPSGLVVAGDFDQTGATTAGVNNIALFDGVSIWSGLPGNVLTISDYISATGIYQGDIVVGGCFNGSIKQISGGIWNNLGTGIVGGPSSCTYPQFFDIAVIKSINGELYVGGGFDSAGGIPSTEKLAKWNGLNWISLGDVDPLNNNGYVADIEEVDYGLMVVGGFNMIDNTALSGTSTAIMDNLGTWNSTNAASGLYSKILKIKDRCTGECKLFLAGEVDFQESSKTPIMPCDTLDWTGASIGWDTICNGNLYYDVVINPIIGNVTPDWIEYDVDCDLSIDHIDNQIGTYNYLPTQSGILDICITSFKIINGDTCSYSLQISIDIEPCPTSSECCDIINWQIEKTGSLPYQIEEHGNKLYYVGDIGNNIYDVFEYDGTNHINLNHPSATDRPNSLESFQNNFYTSNYLGEVHLYSNPGWQSLGDFDDSGNNLIVLLYKTDNYLVACGRFDSEVTSGNSFNNLALWDGSNWINLANLPQNSFINTVTELNGELLITGDFGVTYPYNAILYNLNNNNVSAAPGGVTFNSIHWTEKYQNGIILGGQNFNAVNSSGANIPNTDGLVFFDGNGFSELGTGYMEGNVTDGFVSNGKVYVSGNFGTFSAPYITTQVFCNSSWDIIRSVNSVDTGFGIGVLGNDIINATFDQNTKRLLKSQCEFIPSSCCQIQSWSNINPNIQTDQMIEWNNQIAFKSATDVVIYDGTNYTNTSHPTLGVGITQTLENHQSQLFSSNNSVTSKVYEFNNPGWSQIGDFEFNPQTIYPTVVSLFSSSLGLIASGRFDTELTSGSSFNNLAIWDGSNWNSLSNLPQNSYISGVAELNGQLLIIGDFGNAYPLNTILYDINSNTVAATQGGLSDYNIYWIDNFQNGIIIGGEFWQFGISPANVMAPNTNGLIFFDGNEFKSIGTGYIRGSTFDGYVDGNKLYVSGDYYANPNGNEVVTQELCNDNWSSIREFNSVSISFGIAVYSNKVINSIGTLNFEGIWESSCDLINSLNDHDYANEQFKIFPNPSNSNISVVSNKKSDFKLSIFSLEGRLVIDEINFIEKTEINVSHLNDGIYIVKILDAEGNYSLNKIVVTK